MTETHRGLRRSGLAVPTLFAPTLFAPLLFAGWTLFVWGGRLRNLWLEPGPLDDVSRWSLAGSVIFTVLGLAVLALWFLARTAYSAGSGGGSALGGLRAVLGALAAFTIGVWLVRAVDIALGDHSVPFIVVHVLLAGVSIVLAVLAVRSVLQSPTVMASSEAGEPGRSPVG